MAKYQNTLSATFLERPNRFVALVELNGEIHRVHVKNTGRCKELLVSGAKVYLTKSPSPERKTAYDLIAVEKITEKGKLLINMDSQIPNAVALEWIKKSGMFSDSAVYEREKRFGNSRFDVYVCDGDRKAFVEVKGVTLENDGVAAFPDAPTLRGKKHLNELCRAKEEGFEAYAIFVIQMEGAVAFIPNWKMDPDFAKALRDAANKGVVVKAFECKVTPDSITPLNTVDCLL